MTQLFCTFASDRRPYLGSRRLAGAAAHVVVCALLLVGIAPRAHASGKLLFYDPDANQERILTITELFYDYLSAKHADWTFEPVQSGAAFQQRVDQTDAKFAIVTASYLQHAENALTPLVVPETNGSVFFQKVLVDMGQGPALQLAGKTIAAGVSEGDTANVLSYLKSLSANVAGAFVVSVSKDVDALLAVVFGQADAALVTEASLGVIKQINPTAATKFRRLVQSRNILRAPLCEVGKRATSSERANMLRLIDDLTSDARGEQLLEVLGTNRWVPFKPEMLR